MTIKEVTCIHCSKIYTVELRRYNENNKKGRKFYCSSECRKKFNCGRVELNCTNCNIVFSKFKYQVTENNFCNHSCSATFNNKKRIISDEQKQKVSQSLLLRFENKVKIVKDNNLIYKSRKCKICDKDFEVERLGNHYSKSLVCSSECRSILLSESSKNNMKKVILEGKHKGWQSRNIISYPEKFFITVLKNNNINFIHNYKVNQSDLDVDSKYCYFLDFYLPDKNIDLEIDGKQHEWRKEYDDERDLNISQKYNVYRIKWNYISSDNGKIKMKEKIDKFLEYYNSL